MLEEWKGEYIHGEGYSERLKGTAAAFTIDWDVEDGVITGHCFDDASKELFDVAATINGVIDGNRISFIKKYPYYFQSDETGKLSVFKNLPGVEIHYSGFYSKGRYEGEWEMQVTHKINDVHRLFRFAGSWTLYKVA